MDRITSQVLLFENNYKKEHVHVPLEIMNDHPGATFRFDLLDCHVDICSPELMLQFSDNFDYQNIRRDFIQNEVVNWDLGKGRPLILSFLSPPYPYIPTPFFAQYSPPP